ncbi:hypothetical protein NA57DRAFT_77573 [Rhizodiscina lignyota]|uniref:DNA endonuclease activator Ctp1 C-terminal domain-containing protein n=1 Tax=Rhizodiscina lignyota TaxID=1504668 RepID=A0A9P4IDL4_9PEZI|nr:hypothetical protein NA57DRAFT_77573 [Rhizodiscina lignyota]
MVTAAEWLGEREGFVGQDVARNEKLQRELEAEFARRDQEKEALSSAISDLIIRNAKADALLRENGKLEADLATALQAQRDIASRSEPPGGKQQDGSNDGPTEGPPIPNKEYAALAKKYNTLSQEYKTLKQNHNALKQDHDVLKQDNEVLKLNEQKYEFSNEYLQKKCHQLQDKVKRWEEIKAYEARKQARRTSGTGESTGRDHSTVVDATSEQRPMIDGQNDRRQSLQVSSRPATPSTMIMFSPTVGAVGWPRPPSIDSAVQLDQSRPTSSYMHLDNMRDHRSISEIVSADAEPPAVREATEAAQHEGSAADSHDTPIQEQYRPGTSDSAAQSSQATEDELPQQQDTAPDVRLDEDDEVPIFVSTRPVRHPRHQKFQGPPTEEVVTANVDGRKTIKVKEEQATSSSPVRELSQRKRLARMDTVDLDEVGGNFITPRKRSRYTALTHKPVASFRMPPSLDEKQNARAISVPADIKNEPAEAELISDLHESHPLSLMRSNSDPLVQQAVDENDSPLDNPGFVERRRTLPSRSSLDESQVFHEVSPNERVPPRTSSPASRSGYRKSSDSVAKKIRILAEDGDPHLRGRPPFRKSSSRSPARKLEGNKRLQSLLETETPQKRTLNAFPTPSTSHGSLARGRPTSALRPAVTVTDAAALHTRPPANSRNQTAVTTSVGRIESRQNEKRRQPDTPYRSRPLEQLNLGHFKENPNYIGHHLGMTTARDRETRRCLPGCTRDCCSGAFRALVESGIRPEVSAGLFDSTPIGSQGNENGTGSNVPEEDHRLLRQHLGDSYDREAIKHMPQAEREELIIQARIRLLSDRHGRHKKFWERPKSPPLYWRTDMPSTQEMKEAREKEELVRRYQVKERWEDALRGNGRWIFADE